VISSAGNYPKNRAGQQGYTYVVVMVAVVVLGILAGTANVTVNQVMRRDREAELLYRGLTYQYAIKNYYLTDGKKEYPHKLEDLVKDPRVPGVRRFLREVYPDPFRKDANGIGWKLIQATDGGIQGVVSQNDAESIQQSGFPLELKQLEGKAHYNEWRFQFVPNVSN